MEASSGRSPVGSPSPSVSGPQGSIPPCPRCGQPGERMRWWAPQTGWTDGCSGCIPAGKIGIQLSLGDHDDHVSPIKPPEADDHPLRLASEITVREIGGGSEPKPPGTTSRPMGVGTTEVSTHIRHICNCGQLIEPSHVARCWWSDTGTVVLKLQCSTEVHMDLDEILTYRAQHSVASPHPAAE